MGKGGHLMIMDIIVMMGPLNDGNHDTRNKKQVGNYGGGGAVQKLHPKKAQTLAIIKVVYFFFIWYSELIRTRNIYQ